MLHSGETYDLCDAYFAGYFTSYPEPQLTPYQEIQLVPPGGYIEAPPTSSACAATGASTVSATSVTRPTPSTKNTSATSSGSPSGVASAPTTHPRRPRRRPRLQLHRLHGLRHTQAGEARADINTLYMYSLEEHGGDERPYFTAVEDHIGRTGTHMESRSEGSNLLGAPPEPYFAALSGYFDRVITGERRLIAHTGYQRNRLHFSGFGGDELLGGVQNPVPELAWLLWHLRLPSFLTQLTTWALQRKITV